MFLTYYFFMQHTHFSTFLSREKFSKSSEIGLLLWDRLNMKWQTKYNRTDCGVFAIHHLQTYMGGGVEQWKTNFVEESVRFVHSHRLNFLLTFV